MQLESCLLALLVITCLVSINAVQINPAKTKVWGPGLHPTFITLPARYFFVQFFDTSGNE